MVQLFIEFIHQVWGLVCEMSPYLLLGFLLAGLLHQFVPATLYQRYLSGNSLRSVVLAALFGIPLPLCSCGVIPTAMGLRRQGASKGATISFLIATPQTGVDSIIATLSLLGLPFALLRPLAALVTAVFGGWLVDLGTRGEEAIVPHVTAHHTEEKEPLMHRLIDALRYAFIEMMEDIGKWLVIGLLVAGLITVLVPDSWFALFQGNSLMSILFVLLFSIPMYLCATGSIPIAVALMMHGLTPGAALVLLMAGPASNAASILVIRQVLGQRSLVLYLLSITLGAVLFGLGIDWLLPAEWFTSPIMATASCCHEGPDTFSIICTIILVLLLVNALSPWHLLGESHCHCHEHEGDGHCCCGDHCTCEDDDDETLVLHIDGMHCNHCAATVKRTLATLPGVEKVEVSLAEKTATLVGHANLEEVKKAVESIGFRVILNS